MSILGVAQGFLPQPRVLLLELPCSALPSLELLFPAEEAAAFLILAALSLPPCQEFRVEQG